MCSIESDSHDKEIHTALLHVLDVVEMNQERNHISNSHLFDELLNAYASKLNANLLLPISFSKDYTGVHLGQVYEEADFKLMLKLFKNNGVLDAFYALKILNDADRLLSQLRNINQCDATQQGCIIVGDLHGNFHDLYHLICKYDSPGKQYQFVFNGDYVDRGPKQIEVLLTILYAFLQRPDKVFLNRGNHEDLAMNTSAHFNPNFMTDCRRKYGKYAMAVFNAASNLFSSLPIATTVQTNYTRAFIVHGGISDKTDLDYLTNHLDRKLFSRLLTSPVKDSHSIDYSQATQQLVDILWSDPIYVNDDGKIVPKKMKKVTGCYMNQTRNLGSFFGYDISDRFCKKNNFNYIIRSHECRDKGFSQDHTRCYTIFSASYYLNSNNMGAVIVITPADKKFQVYAYANLGGDLSSQLVHKNHSLLAQFKHLIQLNQFNLCPKFEEIDVNRTGLISQEDWANVLCNLFEISTEHLILIKDSLCECDNELVYYQSMFKKTIFNEDNNLNAVESQNYLMLVKSLFEIIDKNKDNHISLDEAKEALYLISKSNSKYYTTEDECLSFIKQFDVNCDNLIDLNEFYKAFFYDEFALNDNVQGLSVSKSTVNSLIASSSDSSLDSRSVSQTNLSNNSNEDDTDVHVVRL